MRRLTTLASIFTGAFLVLSVTQAHAQEHVVADLNNGQQIFNNGKGTTPACTTCHGKNGMGNDNMGTPRLAGQVPEYIRKQLEDFATDKRHDATLAGTMNRNAKGLSQEDRRDVAAYVYTLAQSHEASSQGTSDLDALAEAGKEIGKAHLGLRVVLYGIPERGVPACRSCHGYNGRGVEPIYPMIGQQKFVYLVNQLKYWRDGTRANDPRGMMQQVAQKLSDEEIVNIATDLAQASPYTRGNDRLPSRHTFVKIPGGGH